MRPIFAVENVMIDAGGEAAAARADFHAFTPNQPPTKTAAAKNPADVIRTFMADLPFF